MKSENVKQQLVANRSAANQDATRQAEDQAALEFSDKRSESRVQRKYIAAAGESPRLQNISRIQALADDNASRRPDHTSRNNRQYLNNRIGATNDSLGLTQLRQSGSERTSPDGAQLKTDTAQTPAVPERSNRIQRFGLESSLSKVIQKRSLRKYVKAIALGLEGAAHITAGILAVVAGAAAATSVVGVPLATAALVAGVGQIVIGALKWVRAGISAAVARSPTIDPETNKPGPSPAQRKWLGALIAFEATIAIGTSIAAAGLVGLIMGIITGAIKLFRGVVTALGKLKKVQGLIIVFESLLGGFSIFGAALAKGAGTMVDIFKMLVNNVKEFRGFATYDEANSGDAQAAGESANGDSEV